MICSNDISFADVPASQKRPIANTQLNSRPFEIQFADMSTPTASRRVQDLPAGQQPGAADALQPGPHALVRFFCFPFFSCFVPFHML